jgi:DNA-binding transcriptional ArsR family regulator
MPKIKSKSGLRPGLCTVCHHPALAEIDRALMQGMSLRPLAALYGLSPSALSRHTKHLRRALAHQRQSDQEARFDAFLDELDLLKTRLDRLFRKSEDDHSLHISLGCIQETLKIITLRARLSHILEGRS